jgi:DNA polymerase kappa
MSLDEAFLDITDYLKERTDKDPETLVSQIRAEIFERTGLTASAGISCNLRLAKLCSNVNKPNGQFYLKPSRSSILSFIRKTPIRKVNGIGKATEYLLAHALDVETCGDLWEKRALVKYLFSEIQFNFLISISLGLGSTSIDT